MAKNIERVNYYEREYLRSLDFEAEQRYHMEMRRRLNMALHLWGIVDGLEMRAVTPLPPGIPAHLEITEGMAIDAYGREIVLFQKFIIDEQLLLDLGITSGGTYPVWITYDPNLTTPPEGGYRVCNMDDQFTRLREACKIIIDRSGTVSNPAQPLPFSELSDDPQKAQWAIRLGRTHYNTTKTPHEVTDATNPNDRTYIGLRAQRVQSPAYSPSNPQPGNDEVLKSSNPLSGPLLLDIAPTVVAEKHLVVGSNFDINIPPAPPTFPKATGNLKVTGDLFLNGDLYAQKTAGIWVKLDEYIKAIIPKVIPDIKVGSKDIPIPQPSAAVASYSHVDSVTLSTNLPAVSGVDIMVGISGINWLNVKDLKANLSTNDDKPIRVLVESIGSQFPTPADPNYVLKFKITIGPTTVLGIPLIPLIESVSVNYVVIFRP